MADPLTTAKVAASGVVTIRGYMVAVERVNEMRANYIAAFLRRRPAPATPPDGGTKP